MGCSDRSSIEWKRLNDVTSATSLQHAVAFNDEKESLLSASLDQYRQLLNKRTIENQDRAKVLYSRIQMHANNSIVLADDFNKIAELELLHLGWAKSLSSPYAQDLDNRMRAFDASAAVFRTNALMQPTVLRPSEKLVFFDSTFENAIEQLNELCLLSRNPWSLTPGQAVVPALVEKVQHMASTLASRMQSVEVGHTGRFPTYSPFVHSVHARILANMCMPKENTVPIQMAP